MLVSRPEILVHLFYYMRWCVWLKTSILAFWKVCPSYSFHMLILRVLCGGQSNPIFFLASDNNGENVDQNIRAFILQKKIPMLKSKNIYPQGSYRRNGKNGRLKLQHAQADWPIHNFSRTNLPIITLEDFFQDCPLKYCAFTLLLFAFSINY